MSRTIGRISRTTIRAAYRTGYEGASRYSGQNHRFDDGESELRGDYQRLKGKSRLASEEVKARPALPWIARTDLRGMQTTTVVRV